MKKFFVAALLTACAALAGCGSKNYSEYPQAGIVIALDPDADTVSVATASDLVYEFYGCEDWMIGDMAAMIMNDSGTPDSVLDDKIISARYAGSAEQFAIEKGY